MRQILYLEILPAILREGMQPKCSVECEKEVGLDVANVFACNYYVVRETAKLDCLNPLMTFG